MNKEKHISKDGDAIQELKREIASIDYNHVESDQEEDEKPNSVVRRYSKSISLPEMDNSIAENNLLIDAPWSTIKKQAFKQLIKKSGSLILANGIIVSSEFIKSYLLVRYGVGMNSLGASNITSTVLNLTVNTVAVLTNQSAVLIAENYGTIKKLLTDGKEIETKLQVNNLSSNIGSIIRQSWCINIISSVPTMIILFSINPLLQFLGQSEEISNLAAAYLYPVSFSVPFKVMLSTNERIFPGVDKEKWLILFKIGVSILSTALSIVFISKWGMQGAGLVLGLQNLIEFIGTTFFITLHNDLRSFQIWNFFGSLPKASYGRKIIMQGLPLVAQQFLMSGSGFAVSLFIGRMGTVRQAIEQIINQYMSMITTVTKGINEASNRLVAQAIGKQEYKMMRLHGNLGIYIPIGVFIGIAFFYNIFPFKLASAFLDEEEITKSGKLIHYSFLLVSAGRLFDVIQEASSASLAGMQDTLYSSLTLLATALGIVLPLSLISVYLTDFDLYGINVAILIGFASAAGCSLRYWSKLSNKIVTQGNFNPVEETSNNCCLPFNRPYIDMCLYEHDRSNSSIEDKKALYPYEVLNEKEVEIDSGSEKDNSYSFFCWRKNKVKGNIKDVNNTLQSNTSCIIL